MPSDPFIGEIFMAGFNFAPTGYALCNGALLSISQNTALFSLLGTTYGGNGTTTFGLPNLQGRVPFCQGTGFNLGQTAGVSSVTLAINNLPAHTHTLNVSSTGGNAATPVNNLLAPDALGGSAPFQTGAANATMSGNAISTVGSAVPLQTLPPYQVVNYYIATQGLFPSRP